MVVSGSCILLPEGFFDISRIKFKFGSMYKPRNSSGEVLCPYSLSEPYIDAVYGVNAVSSMVKFGIYQVLYIKHSRVNMDVLNYWLFSSWLLHYRIRQCLTIALYLC